MSQFGFVVRWRKKVYKLYEGDHHRKYFRYSSRIYIFVYHDPVLFISDSSSFKDKPMGAVSVFTYEELPSSTLLFFQDLVVLPRCYRFACCLSNELVLTLTSLYLFLFDVTLPIGFDMTSSDVLVNESLWCHRNSRESASR